MIEDRDPGTATEPQLAPVVRGHATGGSAIAATRRSTGLRIGLVALLMLALAVPVVIAMNGGDRGDGNGMAAFAAGASAAPQASAKTRDEPDKTGAKKGKADKAGPRGLGPDGLGPPGLRGPGGGGNGAGGQGGPGRPGKGPIAISAIDGSNLSLETDDGWSRTITVTSATTITKGGQTITVSGLAVGDEIRFRQTRNDDGTYTITAIVVRTPKAGGEVSAIDGDTITVKQKDGSTRDVTVTSSTVYTVGKTAGSKSDVKVGSKIAAEGTVSGDTFTASAVHIGLAHAGGVVTGKTADSITVQRPDGTTTVIHVSDSTTFKVKGDAAASMADIAVGSRVRASGTANADGWLDAVVVHGAPAKPVKDHGAKPKAAPTQSSTPG